MRSIYLAALSAAALSATNVAAQTLTFEGESNTIYNAPVTVSGFTIGNVTGDEQHFHFIDSTAFPGFVVSNGTGVLYNDRNTSIFVSSGSAFSLSGFDASTTGPIDSSTGATTLRIQGFLGATLVNSGSFTINGTAFSSFGGLSGSFDRLVFDAVDGGGGFQLDNLNLAGVPEPATWALMILGFGAVGGAMRRRTKASVRFA